MLLQSMGGSGWLADAAMCGVHDAASGALAPVPGVVASSSWAMPPSQAFGPVTSAALGWHPACRLAWSPSVLVPSAWCFLKQLPCRVPADGSRQKLSPSREAKELPVPWGRGTSGEEPRDEGADRPRAVRGSQTARGERVPVDLLPPALRAAPEPGEEHGALHTGVLPSRRGQGGGEAQPVLLASSNARAGAACAPPQLGACPCPGAGGNGERAAQELPRASPPCRPYRRVWAHPASAALALDVLVPSPALISCMKIAGCFGPVCGGVPKTHCALGCGEMSAQHRHCKGPRCLGGCER